MAAPDDDELDDLLSSLDPVEPAEPAPKPGLPGPALGIPRAAKPTVPARPDPAAPKPGDMSLEAALAAPLGFDDDPVSSPPAPPPAFDDAPAAPAPPAPAASPPKTDDTDDTDAKFPRVETGTEPPPIVDLTPRPEIIQPPNGRRFALPETMADVDDGEDELPPIRTPLPPSPANEPEAPETLEAAEAPETLDADDNQPILGSNVLESPLPPTPEINPLLVEPSRRGLPTVVWVGLISFAVAGLGTILYSQVDAFHPERQKTRDQISETEEKRALEAHQSKQPVPGEITIEANEDKAAVWLLLGRTPLESIEFPSNQVHEVRFELEGRETLDAVIDRSHWSTDGGASVATLATKLRRGTSSPPAYPAQGAVKPPAGPKGKGRLVLETDPHGARAWLLIGITPDVRLTGIETRRRYEFKVLKDGFRPAYTVVEADHWIREGREAGRQVSLAPLRRRRK